MLPGTVQHAPLGVKLAATVAYALLSSWLLFRLKRGKQQTATIAAALLFALLDLLLPFAYNVPSEVVVVQIILFHLPVTRPIKLILYAFDRGPLACAASLREHQVLANLPVIPAASLPEYAQKRLPCFQPTRARFLEYAAQLPISVATCIAVRAFAPEALSWPWVCAAQLLGFVAQLTIIMNGAALLGTSLISLPLLAPFDRFMYATSVKDFWSWRWDTIIAMSLRLAVYDPVMSAAKRGGRTPSPAVRTAAGVATFLLSAAIHEYALYVQDYDAAYGPLTLFFLLQPVLIAVEGAGRWAAERAGLSLSAAQKRVGTLVLIFGSLSMFWCAAYMPPYSTVMFSTADVLLTTLGLADWLPHVQAP